MMIRLLPIFLGAALAHRDSPQSAPLESASAFAPKEKMNASHSIFVSMSSMDTESAMAFASQFAAKEPESIQAMNDALDQIIQDIKNSNVAIQKLIDDEIDALGKCGEKAPVDDEAQKDSGLKESELAAAQEALEKLRHQELSLDFGNSTDEAEVEADATKEAINTALNLFNQAAQKRDEAQEAYDNAKQVAEHANTEAKKTYDMCFCMVDKAYKNIVENDGPTADKNMENLKHFRMIQCVMTAFGQDKKEQGAFNECQGKNYDEDDDVKAVDMRENELTFPEDLDCVAQATPAPTYRPGDPTPTPEPTSYPTFKPAVEY